MSLLAFIFIFLSAVLHAGWNLIAKRSGATLAFYASICLVSCLMWIHTQFWTPIPLWGKMPPLFWYFIAASIASDCIYGIFLLRAYKQMEMSTAYPMMRALPLLFTAFLTMALGWGKMLRPIALLGMGVVFVGCIIMPLKEFRDFDIKAYLSKNMLTIFIVACGTTGYTIFDSEAQKVLRSVLDPSISRAITSMTYYSTRSILLTSTLFVIVFLNPVSRQELFSIIKERNRTPLYAGLFASFAYFLVLLSMNYVTNVSFVQVFRQMGMLLGMLGGILILKERPGLPKYAGVTLIITGLILTLF